MAESQLSECYLLLHDPHVKCFPPGRMELDVGLANVQQEATIHPALYLAFGDKKNKKIKAGLLV